MATSTILSNPVVTVNSVDLSDQCTSATFTQRYAELTATAFGDVDNKYVKGLGDHEVTLDLYMSYAASETYATLKDLVGTATTVVVKPAVGTDSATNPGFTLTGAFLAELPHSFALGELSTTSITFHGGVYTADVTP
ncbi:hypothetical protein UFOVP738_22 [uncultured Caudovirales phage]|jgi:hypothetical protein|uniref:Uncharacterized protein n=1 Tax=uncultured Caudovirales phage TaxID=2100421 RepID=A0A6J7X3C7_9CAUD|nr:hypothetical protein UFOVP738_22 [uncultured Caudovirales phage]